MANLFQGSRSFSEALQIVFDKRARALGGALPGNVVSYDPATHTATVKPGVHRLVPSVEDFDEDLVEELPAIHGVPIQWPRARGFALVGSLSPGDPVLLVCMDRDMSAWLRTGSAAAPDDARPRSWASCVAIPGLVPSKGGYDAPTDAAALASRVEAELASLRTTVNALVSAMHTHVHTLVTSGTDSSGPSPTVITPADPIGDTHSTILKLGA